MKHYLATQEDKGVLISLAIVREDGRSLHIVFPHDGNAIDPELSAALKNCPEAPVFASSRLVASIGAHEFIGEEVTFAGSVRSFEHMIALLAEYDKPWPRIWINRVDAAPLARIPRNAWWEAVALAEHLGAELGG